MRGSDDPDKLPLPKQWPHHAKAAVLNAISLAASAFVLHLERWANKLSRRTRALAGIERQDVRYLEGRQYLPVIEVRSAA